MCNHGNAYSHHCVKAVIVPDKAESEKQFSRRCVDTVYSLKSERISIVLFPNTWNTWGRAAKIMLLYELLIAFDNRLILNIYGWQSCYTSFEFHFFLHNRINNQLCTPISNLARSQRLTLVFLAAKTDLFYICLIFFLNVTDVEKIWGVCLWKFGQFSSHWAHQLWGHFSTLHFFSVKKESHENIKFAIKNWCWYVYRVGVKVRHYI